MVSVTLFIYWKALNRTIRKVYFKGNQMKKNGRNWDSDIILLDRVQWEGHQLMFRYTAHNYYDLVINQSDGSFKITLVKKPFDEPFYKTPDDTDKLFQPWWDDVKAWGIIVNEQIIAVIETAVEQWSNRLIVTELWIDDNHRRKGIATALMDIAKKRAIDENRRVLMLETQSCNEGAIAFYLHYGFELIGFDKCAYQNNDVDRKEVRINLGILINDKR